MNEQFPRFRGKMRAVEALRRALLRLRRGWHNLPAPVVLVLGFAVVTAEGTLGLMLLPGLHTGPPPSLVDALFTMTSAVCISGLAVADTATAFTRQGQLWIILHIQLGGIGLITLTTLVIGAMGRTLSLRSEMLVGTPAGFAQRLDLRTLGFLVARFTIGVELVGFLLLFPPFALRYGMEEGAWHALFHAVNAFCNAGFSTFPTSLVEFAESPFVLLVVSALVFLGAFGFAEARARFLPLFFEVVSAFGTCGLSMDVTPTLSSAGRVLVTALMFVGRVGPLAFFATMSLRASTHVRTVRSAQEDLVVG